MKKFIILLILLVVGILSTSCVKMQSQPDQNVLGDNAPMNDMAVAQNGLCPNGKADLDGDGYCGDITQDCDDTDPSINPNSEERCDGVDNDCDGKLDEGCVAECQDECSPEGTFCSGITLKKCMDSDDDPCLDITRIECTFGCMGSTSCRNEPAPTTAPTNEELTFARPADRTPQSEIYKEPIQFTTNETCEGEFVGDIEWRADGGLCRKEGDYQDAVPQYVQPMHCCNRYFSAISCVVDKGEVPGQYYALPNKYHSYGCFRV